MVVSEDMASMATLVVSGPGMSNPGEMNICWETALSGKDLTGRTPGEVRRFIGSGPYDQMVEVVGQPVTPGTVRTVPCNGARMGVLEMGAMHVR